MQTVNYLAKQKEQNFIYYSGQPAISSTSDQVRKPPRFFHPGPRAPQLLADSAQWASSLGRAWGHIGHFISPSCFQLCGNCEKGGHTPSEGAFMAVKQEKY